MAVHKYKKSVTSSNIGSQQRKPFGVFVHYSFLDANGAKKELESQVFATKELAEAARIGMDSVLMSLGAQNIESIIEEKD